MTKSDGKARPSTTQHDGAAALVKALAALENARENGNEIEPEVDAVLEAASDLGLFSASDRTEVAALPRHVLESHGLGAARKPRRNDRKRPPAGYQFIGPFLAETWDIGPPSDATLGAARALLLQLANLFDVAVAVGGPRRSLSFVLRHLLQQARPRGSMRDRAKAVEESWAAWARHTDVGRAQWERLLEAQLEMDAVHRAEERANGGPLELGDSGALLGPLGEAAANQPHGAFERPASGEQILAYVRYTGVAVPKELTASAIERMRWKVALGGRGRAGGKLPRVVVAEFSNSLTKPVRHRRKSAAKKSKSRKKARG